jgi:2-polyprenyl-6-methoxyphenol hydroxylase-like FAD-dependent oxidoreductase
MASTFKIHPAIGLARVGNSPTAFYLAPETEGALPIDCDADGNPIVKDGYEQPISTFKDDQGRIKRQAARFRVYVYDERSPEGRELQVGEQITVVNQHTGQRIVGELIDITWTVYLANKKASWYAFQELAGEHGYAPDHPLRNADLTDPQARQQLIIDPGPRSVSYIKPQQRVARFAKDSGGITSFPPPLQPHSITTLGEIRATQQGQYNRLLVLGGFGNAGSCKTGFGQPMIHTYANNDGWFDDTSDGPVNAVLHYNIISIDGRTPPPGQPPGSTPVDAPAWVIVGYPRYAPQIVDLVTMNDLVYDLSVRQFAYDPLLYGVPPFAGRQQTPKTPQELQTWRQNAQWNPDYRPYFWRDIWPILTRPYNYQWVMDFDPFTGGDPHETGAGSGGNFDPGEIAIPPYSGEDPLQQQNRHQRRLFVYRILRQPGDENRLTVAPDPHNPHYQPLAMPFLCGDNPLSNVAVAKFLRLTDTQLFLLRQWAEGKFINEQRENIAPVPQRPPGPGVRLDQGVLANALGGSFCPGAEACWIMRNPAIYPEPYRIHQAPNPIPGSLSLPGNLPPPGPDVVADLAAGLEPGDLTKYSALPWQSDFNECATQDVNITYTVGLVEISTYDTPRVGEMLSPLAEPLLRHLGVLARFEREGHLPTYSTSAAWGGRVPMPNEFFFSPPWRGWQLDRARFDRMLAQAAQEAGVDFFHARPGDLQPRADGSWQIDLRGRAEPLALRATFVVDATGRRAAIATRQRVYPVAYDALVGIGRFFQLDVSSRCEGATLVEAWQHGWWYSAPLPDHRLVVVAMTDTTIARHLRLRQSASWDECLAAVPYTRQRLVGTVPLGKPWVRAAHSQRLVRCIGENWLAVGDAASAVDPLSSQGIVRALRFGIYASYGICDWFAGRPPGLAQYAALVQAEFEHSLSIRAEVYSTETRWPDAPFWARRNLVPPVPGCGHGPTGYA